MANLIYTIGRKKLTRHPRKPTIIGRPTIRWGTRIVRFPRLSPAGWSA